jgi:hypothetical protein
MTRSETIRTLAAKIGPPFREDPVGSGVFHWKTRLGRWPFELQVDRFALELRCYLADELFCTGRIPEDEVDGLFAASGGALDAAVVKELAEFVDASVGADSRRFLAPPHADRHPDRRADSRQASVTEAKPGRKSNEPA